MRVHIIDSMKNDITNLMLSDREPLKWGMRKVVPRQYSNVIRNFIAMRTFSLKLRLNLATMYFK